MLDRDRLQRALEAVAPAFEDFEAARSGRLESLRQVLDSLHGPALAELQAALGPLEAPGALPTDEWSRGWRIPFGRRFEDHPDSRRWAMEVLEGRPTFAADGSQIEPDARFSVPVALVQVASFENPHTGLDYRKDAELRVLGPQELREDELGPPKRKVDLARFELEVAALRRYLAAPQGPPSARLAFFDGSLIVSFAEKRQQDHFARRYVQGVTDLLADSQRAGVPLVAYVDTSMARDLVTMLAAWQGGGDPGGLSDGALLLGRMGWGDRTPVAICARSGILDHYGPSARRIGFCYLQTNQDAPPARVEFPLWLHEQGLLDDVLDRVRAEAIVGVGYPYVLAAADATAVLTSADRDAFYRMFQGFMERRSLPLRFSRKALSKIRRR